MGPRMAYSVPKFNIGQDSLGARTRPTVVPKNLTCALFFPRERIHFKSLLLLLTRDSCCFPGMPQNMFRLPWVCPPAPSSVSCRCMRTRLPSDGWLFLVETSVTEHWPAKYTSNFFLEEIKGESSSQCYVLTRKWGAASEQVQLEKLTRMQKKVEIISFVRYKFLTVYNWADDYGMTVS